MLEAGIRGVLAFPLTVGAVGFGVLEVYVDDVGDLETEAIATITNLARVATEILFDGRGSDGAGALDLLAALDHRIEIHQAQGMVMVALGTSLVDALLSACARLPAEPAPAGAGPPGHRRHRRPLKWAP